MGNWNVNASYNASYNPSYVELNASYLAQGPTTWGNALRREKRKRSGWTGSCAVSSSLRPSHSPHSTKSSSTIAKSERLNKTELTIWAFSLKHRSPLNSAHNERTKTPSVRQSCSRIVPPRANRCHGERGNEPEDVSGGDSEGFAGVLDDRRPCTRPTSRFQISAIQKFCESLCAGPESFLIDAVKSGTLFKICSANPGAHSEPLFCRQ